MTRCGEWLIQPRRCGTLCGVDPEKRTVEMADLWSYRNPAWLEGGDLVGYQVHASDGDIGEVEEMADKDGHAGIVVETGHWIFGKKRLIPAGAILQVDHADREVRISLSKDEVKGAVDHHPRIINEHAHRSAYADYFEDIPHVI